MKLANRIFLSISGIIAFSVILSSIIGAVLVSNATHSEAISRVRRGLKEARLVVNQQLDSLALSAHIMAEGLQSRISLPIRPDVTLTYRESLPPALTSLGIGGTGGRSGVVNLSTETLDDLGMAEDRFEGVITCPGGLLMCLFATARGDAGAVFACIVLNGNFGLVRRIQETLFGTDMYGDKPFGTVTVFCRDTRVATTVLGPEGRLAMGTKVSDVVKNKVLLEGDVWLDRAYVVDEWYLSAYEPIRSPGGENIGILYVGVLEQKYTDIRNRAILILLLVSLPALGLLLLGTYFLARGIVRPLSNLARVAQNITRGHMDVKLPGSAGDREVASLARSFERMVAAVDDREKKLKQKNVDLEKANRDYQELLSFVTHELNNSIGSLLLNISILGDDSMGKLSAEQKEVTDLVLRDIERFRDMVKNYLNLSRLEKGTLRFNPTDIDVRSQVVEPVLQRLTRWIRHRGVDIQWNWSGRAVVHGDSDLLRICYSNLIVNALKYGKDWIRFTARPEEAGNEGRSGGSEERAPGYWVLGVANGGEPIPKEKIDLLFRKFSRLVNSDDGAGLGLYLVREIIQRHGGEVWCESDAVNGTRFLMRLPARAPGAEQAQSAPASQGDSFL